MTLKPTYSLFLEILRFALWGEGTYAPKEEYPEKAYDSAIRIATDQAVLGLVGDVIVNRFKGGCPLSQDKGLETGFMVYKIKSKHKLLDSVLGQMSICLREADIQRTLLKGEGVSTLYKDPTLRQSGDIDMYVGKGDYLKAIKAIEKILDPQKPVHKTIKHYECSVREVDVEIHKYADILSFRPKKNKYFQRMSQKGLYHSSRSATFGNESIQLPNPDFDAVFLLQHLWNHLITEGVGFRQICDWTMLLHSYGASLDKDKLEKDLHACGIFRAWKYMAYIVVNYLGLPKEECPLYSEDKEVSTTAKEILALIFEDGNFGKRNSHKNNEGRPDNYFGSKLHSLKNNFRRLGKTLKYVDKSDRPAYYLEYLRGTTERL